MNSYYFGLVLVVILVALIIKELILFGMAKDGAK